MANAYLRDSSARINANASLILFTFESHDVRLKDRNGEPWFVLADVCRALDIKNVTQAADRLDRDEKTTLCLKEGRTADASTITTNDSRAGHGPQSLNIINESGLYSLILTSRKPAAKRFKKWVTSEVLATIRKTGGYQAAAAHDPRIDYMMKIVGQFAGNQRFVTEDRFDHLVAAVNKMADAIVKIANDRDPKTDPEPEVAQEPKRIARDARDHWQDFVLEWADARIEPFRLIDMFPDLASEHKESKDMGRRARELRIARILRAHGYDKRGMKPKGRMNSVYWEKANA